VCALLRFVGLSRLCGVHWFFFSAVSVFGDYWVGLACVGSAAWLFRRVMGRRKGLGCCGRIDVWRCYFTQGFYSDMDGLQMHRDNLVFGNHNESLR
jgi:hypothetical protein